MLTTTRYNRYVMVITHLMILKYLNKKSVCEGPDVKEGENGVTFLDGHFKIVNILELVTPRYSRNELGSLHKL